ncbi:hypothetical protein V5O48_000224 [Marasmius crinis-equi]|uniref:THO1-MOS11 C-terminal domain-containing protein n=1 Tax=Marasmius crinis-equi TaxID=585013 RepID=A0ABR3G277_9AGAR
MGKLAPPAKANKQELISRILVSQEAIAVYNVEHGEIEESSQSWSQSQSQLPGQLPLNQPPLSIQHLPSTQKKKNVANALNASAFSYQPASDIILKSRAARFGISVDDAGKRLDAKPKSNPKKRASPVAATPDPEEQERRTKRAERFGLVNKEEEAKKEARAARFGTKS